MLGAGTTAMNRDSSPAFMGSIFYGEKVGECEQHSISNTGEVKQYVEHERNCFR